MRRRVESSPRRRGGGGTTFNAVKTAAATARGRVGLTMTAVVCAIAFVGPLISSKSPTAFVSTPYATPGSGDAGFLGADALGRDVVTRLLDGGRSLLLVAVAATVLAVSIGAVAGVVAAYRQGIVGGLIMRAVDILLAFPQIVFVLLVVSVLGANSWLLIGAVTVVQAPGVCRVIYAAAQDICERDFVRAVALWGVPPRKVIARQVLPNLATPLAVEAGLRLSFSIIIISGINFLGFGAQPPNPSWGVMVNENRLGLSSNVWGVVAPAIILAVLAVGTNMFADAFARAAFGEDRANDVVAASTGAPIDGGKIG